MTQTSADDLVVEDTHVRRRVISILVYDRPGVLHRIVGVISGRGFNIENLSVSPVHDTKRANEQHDPLSRITIVTTVSDHMLEQMLAQFQKPIDVVEAEVLSRKSSHVEASVTFLKLFKSGAQRQIELIAFAKQNHLAVSVETRPHWILFRFTGGDSATKAFIAAMEAFGDIETASTGITALA